MKFNSFRAKRGNSAETSFHIAPRDIQTVRIADAGEIVIIENTDDGINHIVFSQSGEYIITTLVEGRFLAPETPVESFKGKWRFIVNLESRTLDLELIEERAAEDELEN